MANPGISPRAAAHFAFPVAFFIALALLFNGCAWFKRTEPPRAATEQLLLSVSADRAMASVNLTIFANRKVYLDTGYFDSYDSKYAIGEIRDALSRAGALLESNPTNSDIIIEARAGALSTDSAETLFGVPSTGLPVPLAGAVSIPEIAIYKSQKQDACAKIALLAYANDSREHIYSSGPLVGKSYNHYHKFLFLSWIRTDLPERQKKQEDAAKYEVWSTQFDYTNFPTGEKPATSSATNAPAEIHPNPVLHPGG